MATERDIPTPPRKLPDTVMDIGVRHQVYLERVAAQLGIDIQKVVGDLEGVIIDWINSQSTNLTELSSKQLQRLLVEAKKDQLSVLMDGVSFLLPQLEELGNYESVFQARALKKMTRDVEVRVLEAAEAFDEALLNPIAATGEVFKDFTKGWVQAEVDSVGEFISKAWTQGWTNDDMARAIRGTKAAGYSDGLMARVGSNANTVVRTSVMHVANTAQEATWAANSDIIQEEQVVATLDSRTTPGCRELDGQRFPLGEGPSFPRHYNCRTIKVPVIQAKYQFLMEGATRSSETGPVSAKQTYYQWLQDQPAPFQDDALGPTRAKLFRDGGLSAEDFGRLNIGRNFEPLTLAEMRKKEPNAFRKAGL